MANFIVSYDLNGPYPTHAQVDAHLEKLGAVRGRVLETVWYVGWTGNRSALYDEVNSLLSENDRLLVLECLGASFRNLLVDSNSFVQEWAAHS